MDEHTDEAAEVEADPCPHCGQPVGDAWLVCAWCGRQIAAPAELAVGATLAEGRYQVLRIIGRGGFGITYEAGDTKLKRRVAIKELFPESAVRHGSMVLTPPHARAAFKTSRERFLLEARVLARFTHPGIVRVYEVFEEHGTAYLVMELLSGRTLVDILRTRGEPFTEPELFDVAGRVAAALRPVHAAGVLHRDVNPSNVMLTEHGRIVVIDFGLARTFQADHTMGMTRMVTPGYAPLEQYRGEARFGPSTDVYGLAATMYRLATGRVPVAAVERDAGAALPAPQQLNPALAKSTSDAILDGLELQPAHRPQDLDAFLARLGVRFLPDAPRSVLLGSPGAEAEDLALGANPNAPIPALPGPAVVGPLPSPPLAPPVPAASSEPVGPVAPRAPVEPVPVATAMLVPPVEAADPNGPVVTERVPPAGTPPVSPDSDATAPLGRPAASATADADRTFVPESSRMADPGPAVARSAAAPWTDGADVPAISAWSRAKVTVPLAVLAVVAASAAPLIIIGLMVLVILPALATVGDGVAQRRRRERGFAGGEAERRLPAGLLVPFRFVRNMGLSILRTSPIIGLAVVLLASWYAFAQTSLAIGILHGFLRLIGAGTMAAILLTNRDGSSRFRSGLGIQELADRAVPDGRITERLVVAWIVMVVLVVFALWLDPAPFPLPRP